MAEFCSICSPEGFDIDILQEALALDVGHSSNFICEGCNARAVYKDENGFVYLVRKSGAEFKFYPIKIDE